MNLFPTAVSRFQPCVLAVESAPAQPSSTNGTLQLRTVTGIVIGVVGFGLLVFSFSFISRRCCGRPESTPSRSHPSDPENVPRRQPRAQHVDHTVIAVSMTTPRSLRLEPVDGAPPPYHVGPRLPPYTEQNSGQALCSPEV
ncbi:hypothetical protein BS17DRAFT_787731 [Gyrodon lividus]|nr:hypothetical protein BS17DRAFT_787731 [Gyrodon lividus]